ncbi:S1 family peptidase [Nitrospira sp. CMX1]|nr:trypsin-like peptidase domain-containing protein [Nitrospira sp.]
MSELSSFSLPHEVLRLMMRCCFEHTVSVFWGEPDGEPEMHSASGVLIKLDRPILITAEHVIEEFLKKQTEHPSIRLQIAKGSIENVAERIIARSKKSDLVTLDLSGLDLREFAQHLSLYTPLKWPPHSVMPGLTVLIVGFPMAYRYLLPIRRAIKFDSFCQKVQVSSVNECGFACAVETNSIHNLNSDDAWPETYGGMSGCPIFAIRGNPSVLDLVGIVYEASDSFNIICARHANLVSPDGTLSNP